MPADTKRVGLLLSMETDFGRRVLRGVKQYALANAHWRFAYRGTRPVVTLKELARGEVDGVIAQVWSAESIRYLKALKVPVVNVSNSVSEAPFARVRTDDMAIGELAAEHLIARGHEDLAFSGPPGDRYVLLRREGFVRAAGKSGLEVLVAPENCYGGPPSSEAGRRMDKWLSGLPKPVGLMASSDNHGRQVVFHCEQLGLRIPDDVAIVGVDNDELQADLAVLPLTSIDPAFETIGHRAAELLDGRMAGRAAPEADILIPPRGLVERASTEGLAVGDELVRRAAEFIRTHAAEQITVDDVLDEVLVSRRKLEKSFRAALGHTPYAHLIKARLHRAKRLLTETDLPVNAVAEAAGFGDARQFSTTFRKSAGMTPSAFRQQFSNR